MSTTTKGLHTCKPSNQPRVGDVKTFAIEHKTGKSGTPYIKIKSAGPEYGGVSYRIVSAEKTDFVDAHGNLSFNLEIEQVGAAGAHEALSTPPSGPARQPQPRQQSSGDPVAEANQRLAKVMNAMYLVEQAVAKEQKQATADGIPVTPEGFGGKCSSAYREIAHLVDAMPTQPVWDEGIPF